MSDLNRDTLLEFPCRFPIKIIGHADADLRQVVLEIVLRHVDDFNPDDLVARDSANGRYIAFTLEFTARSKAQLDNLYREASAHPRVIMVL